MRRLASSFCSLIRLSVLGQNAVLAGDDRPGLSGTG